MAAEHSKIDPRVAFICAPMHGTGPASRGGYFADRPVRTRRAVQPRAAPVDDNAPEDVAAARQAWICHGPLAGRF